MDLRGAGLCKCGGQDTRLRCQRMQALMHACTQPVMVAVLVYFARLTCVTAWLKRAHGLMQAALPRLKADCRKVHGRTGWLRRSC